MRAALSERKLRDNPPVEAESETYLLDRHVFVDELGLV
jgi:hypothetical protein